MRFSSDRGPHERTLDPSALLSGVRALVRNEGPQSWGIIKPPSTSIT